MVLIQKNISVSVDFYYLYLVSPAGYIFNKRMLRCKQIVFITKVIRLFCYIQAKRDKILPTKTLWKNFTRN